MEPGRVYFVGAGPGDPELITVKGRRLLDAADYVLFTGSLVPDVLFAGLKAQVEDSKGIDLDEMERRLVTHAKAGLRVVRAHTGDPSIYGAIHEQIVRLERAGVPWEIVPGVTSAFAAAAALGAELTIPDLTQTVILSRVEGRTPMPDGEKLADLAGHGTLCLYLSATLTDKLARELIQAGLAESTPVGMVQYASMPNQRILRGTLGSIAEQVRAARMREQVMILIGPALDPELKIKGGHESRLYASDFSHRFRRATASAEETP
ncbi:MAG: precorrin-4 C(11)-methyltransferase [Deltaproteobacteria bacterium]|nr:precorrin-4 C(11)-methyltransferase [Deltaproteobacteria bacterium]